MVLKLFLVIIDWMLGGLRIKIEVGEFRERRVGKWVCVGNLNAFILKF